MKARSLRVIRWAAVLCLAGGGYALFVWLTGVGIPCPIHTLTGLYCPGCGVSRFCLALLRLDFAGAFYSNMALFVLLPPGMAVLAVSVVRYIHTGDSRLSRWQAVLVYGMIALLLLFGVLRNLPAFSVLSPR